MYTKLGKNKVLSRKNGITTFLVKYKSEVRKATIDTDDEYILTTTWSYIINYNGRNNPRVVRATIKQKQVTLHRTILNVKGSKKHVDHIDGNPLNNCKSNLRVCSSSQNMRNQKVRYDSKTGYKGVCYSKIMKKYRAYIVKNYKQIPLGYFNTTIEAAKAYNKAAIKFHGKFARLNFIKEAI